MDSDILSYFSRSAFASPLETQQPQQTTSNLIAKSQVVLTPSVEQDEKKNFPNNSDKFPKESPSSSTKLPEISNPDIKPTPPITEGEDVSSSQKERNFVCEVCGKAYFYHQNLSVHKKKHDIEGRPEECPICAARFGKKSSMRIHISCTHLKNIQQGKELTDEEKKWTEEQCMALIKEKCYSCEKCGKMFATHGKLEKHQAKHENLKHVCTHCGEKFAFYFEYQKHLKAKHPNGGAEYKYTPSGRIICDVCSKDFKNIESLKFHVKEQHSESTCDDGDEKNLFRCPHEGCLKCYNRQANLNAHIRKVHLQLEKGLWVCSICKTELSTKATFKRHMKKLHNKTEAQMKTEIEGFEKIFKERMKEQQEKEENEEKEFDKLENNAFNDENEEEKPKKKKKTKRATSSKKPQKKRKIEEIEENSEKIEKNSENSEKIEEIPENTENTEKNEKIENSENSEKIENDSSTSTAPPTRKRRKLNNVMKTLNNIFGQEVNSSVTVMKND